MNLDDLAKKILLPLELEGIKKRDKKSLAHLGLLSAAWPISAPLTLAYGLTKEDKYPDSDFPSEEDFVMAKVVAAPFWFFKELFVPEHQYFKIRTYDNLEEANDINPRIRFYEENQDQDGPDTCSGLEVIYSDGLYLQVFPGFTNIRKLDLDIDKLVDYIDEHGNKWSKPCPRGKRIGLDPECNPQMRFLSTVYRDAPFSLKTNPELKKELDAFL